MSNDTQTLTLTDFLLARIAEDEAVARAAAPGWRGPEPMGVLEGSQSLLVDPARVLAECEAKRRIVELRATAAYHADQFASSPPDDPFRLVYMTTLSTYDAVLRSLALPYADHPDYSEEWKP